MRYKNTGSDELFFCSATFCRIFCFLPICADSKTVIAGLVTIFPIRRLQSKKISKNGFPLDFVPPMTHFASGSCSIISPILLPTRTRNSFPGVSRNTADTSGISSKFFPAFSPSFGKQSPPQVPTFFPKHAAPTMHFRHLPKPTRNGSFAFAPPSFLPSVRFEHFLLLYRISNIFQRKPKNSIDIPSKICYNGYYRICIQSF